MYGAATEIAGLQVPVVIGAALATLGAVWAWRQLPRLVRGLERAVPIRAA
jgi:hypothetical protein